MAPAPPSPFRRYAPGSRSSTSPTTGTTGPLRSRRSAWAASCTANAGAARRRRALRQCRSEERRSGSVTQVGVALAAQVDDAVLHRLLAGRGLAVAGETDAQHLGIGVLVAEDVGHRRHLAASRVLAADVAHLLGGVDGRAGAARAPGRFQDGDGARHDLRTRDAIHTHLEARDHDLRQHEALRLAGPDNRQPLVHVGPWVAIAGGVSEGIAREAVWAGEPAGDVGAQPVLW